MPKPDSELAFFDAKQIRELAERALAAYPRLEDLAWDGPDRRTEHQAKLARDAAVSALWYCAQAIACLADPDLWDLAVRIPEVVGERILDCAYWSRGTEAIAALIERGAEAKQLEYCARHADASIRYAAARSVPLDAKGISVLRGLCEDADPEVRKISSERLAKVTEVAWWTGRFSFDPFEALSPQEAEQHKSTVVELGEALTAGHLPPERLSSVLDRAATLPPAVACDVVKRLAVAGFIGRFGDAGSPPRAAAILVGAGALGTQILESLVDAAAPGIWPVLDPYLVALSPEPRFGVLQSLLRRLEENLHRDDSWDSPAYNLSATLGRQWPGELDPSPLLEVALARQSTRFDPIASHLAVALDRTVNLEPIKARLIEQHLNGFEGQWKYMELPCRNALRRLAPDDLDALTRRSMDSGQESAIVWALTLRIENAEARGDGAAQKLVLALDDDPALRPLMRSRFGLYLLPRLRQELVEGKLDHRAARAAMMLIASHWGGVVHMAPTDWPSTTEPEFAFAPSPPNEKMLSYLPPESRQAATPEEWAAYRALRERATFDGAGDHRMALILTPSARPWLEPDRAVFDRALAYAADDPERFLVVQLGWMIFTMGEAPDLALLDRLEELAGTDTFARPSILNMRTAFRKRLGLPELPEQGAGTSASAIDEDDWADDA